MLTTTNKAQESAKWLPLNPFETAQSDSSEISKCLSVDLQHKLMLAVQLFVF